MMRNILRAIIVAVGLVVSVVIFCLTADTLYTHYLFLTATDSSAKSVAISELNVYLNKTKRSAANYGDMSLVSQRNDASIKQFDFKALPKKSDLPKFFVSITYWPYDRDVNSTELGGDGFPPASARRMGGAQRNPSP